MSLYVDNISFKYKDRNVICGASIEAGSGDVIAIIGSNGCGKTTLLKLIAGLLIPDKGVIRIDNKNAQFGIGVSGIIEQPRFWNEMTARDNHKYYLEDEYDDTRIESSFISL